MNLVQASFQASVDARVERLDDAQLDELRTIFRYFDTDGDGAVAAGQACRMFALLGLDVDARQVQALGEVYLAEFIKIVDSHSPASLPSPRDAETTNEPAEPSREAQAATDGGGGGGGGDSTLARREAALQRCRELSAREWKLLDTHRRGRVSRQELTRFLASCTLDIPATDLQRLLELYGEPDSVADPAAGDADEDAIEGDGSALVLTEAGFLRFRLDFTAKDLAAIDDQLSSAASDEEEGDEGGGGVGAREEPSADRSAPRQPVQQLSASASTNSRHSDSDTTSPRLDHLLVDPSGFQESEYGSEPDDDGEPMGNEPMGGEPVLEVDALALDG